ncbi:hypothetical protein EVAR_94628_1 [Eumeta japonica]|uniref:Uncharacterized protein n=1 Tax=Eumeta variegata TaxID=151549 RepID=A0A4C1UTM6_EUMVA|nr:hypothetical protein EVAR_94628_1 [Eumeta japonica]
MTEENGFRGTGTGLPPVIKSSAVVPSSPGALLVIPNVFWLSEDHLSQIQIEGVAPLAFHTRPGWYGSCLTNIVTDATSIGRDGLFMTDYSASSAPETHPKPVIPGPSEKGGTRPSASSEVDKDRRHRCYDDVRNQRLNAFSEPRRKGFNSAEVTNSLINQPVGSHYRSALSESTYECYKVLILTAEELTNACLSVLNRTSHTVKAR